MDIIKKLIKDGNLHHAHGIESNSKKVLEELENIFKENKDFEQSFIKEFKSFGIEDSRELKRLQSEKSIENKKRVFILYISSITREAQNSLLKVLEEPSSDSHFFLIIPKFDYLLPTLKSRLSFLRIENMENKDNFIFHGYFLKMNLKEKLDFIKKNTDKKLKEEDRISKIQAINLLNSIEEKYSSKEFKNLEEKDNFFQELISIRKYLMRNGSSIKMLLDHFAVLLTK